MTALGNGMLNQGACPLEKFLDAVPCKMADDFDEDLAKYLYQECQREVSSGCSDSIAIQPRRLPRPICVH